MIEREERIQKQAYEQGKKEAVEKCLEIIDKIITDSTYAEAIQNAFKEEKVQTAQKGWECPKCGKIWASWIPCCNCDHNNKITS